MKTMASVNGVALVLAISFLLSALSGEAFLPIADPLPKAGGVPSPSPSLSYSLISSKPPKSSRAPSPSKSLKSKPSKKSAVGVAPSSPLEGSPTASPASSITLDFELPLEMPAESQPPSSLPKDQLEKLTNFLQAQLNAAYDKVEKFSEDIIEKRLSDESTDENTKKCLATCKEVYGDARDDIHKAQEDIGGSLWYKARVDISAFSTDIETCQDCFVEMEKEDPEILEFEKWAQGVSTECLGKLEVIDK